MYINARFISHCNIAHNLSFVIERIAYLLTLIDKYDVCFPTYIWIETSRGLWVYANILPSVIYQAKLYNIPSDIFIPKTHLSLWVMKLGVAFEWLYLLFIITVRKTDDSSMWLEVQGFSRTKNRSHEMVIKNNIFECLKN